MLSHPQRGKQNLFSSLTSAHLRTATFIAHVFFCPPRLPGEQCFLNPVATDLYLSAPFDGIPADLLGGEHLKSLSEKLGAWGPTASCASTIPPDWGWTRKSGERQTPTAITCYSRWIDCYIKRSLNPLPRRLTSGTPETWDTHRPNARDSCFGRLKYNTGITLREIHYVFLLETFYVSITQPKLKQSKCRQKDNWCSLRWIKVMRPGNKAY